MHEPGPEKRGVARNTDTHPMTMGAAQYYTCVLDDGLRLRIGPALRQGSAQVREGGMHCRHPSYTKSDNYWQKKKKTLTLNPKLELLVTAGCLTQYLDQADSADVVFTQTASFLSFCKLRSNIKDPNLYPKLYARGNGRCRMPDTVFTTVNTVYLLSFHHLLTNFSSSSSLHCIVKMLYFMECR